MVEQTFGTFIASERERLNKEREAIFNQQHELDGALVAINNELRAIDAYEAVKTGKSPAPATRQTRGLRAGSRAPRGSKREHLMQVIRDNPYGLTRGEIL